MRAEDKPGSLAAGVSRREVWAWAMFDFANSGYTTVVITAIFNAYFVAVVAQNASWGTFAWTLSLGLSYGLILLTAPVLGAYADAYGAKKRLLLLSAIGCVVFTALLYFAGPGSLWVAMTLHCAWQFLFWNWRKPDCSVFAGAGEGRRPGQSVWMGVESGLYRRAGEPGLLSGVRDLGTGASACHLSSLCPSRC